MTNDEWRQIESKLENVGTRINFIRKQRQMSLQEVADKACLSKAHIWDLERGKARNMTVRTVVKISIALGTTPSDLLSFDFATSCLTDKEIQVALAARYIYSGVISDL